MNNLIKFLTDPQKQSKRATLSWSLTLVLGLAAFASHIQFGATWVPTYPLMILCGLSFVWAMFVFRQGLSGRTAAFGLNSFITSLLVIAIVAVLNFLASRYPKKLDLTQNKIHSLSDQTEKLIKGLQKPIKAVFYADMASREKNKVLLEGLKGLNPKFELEYVDPNRELSRAKAAGIKQMGTLHIIVPSDRPDQVAREQKIEDVSEEKITNSLIKMLKTRSQLICSISGHGERSFGSDQPEGMSMAKKGLSDQSYEVKDFNLIQDTRDGKIPDTCDIIALLGGAKPFMPQEVSILKSYLEEGGRALIALDVTPRDLGIQAELFPILESWHIKPILGLIVDPVSKMLGVDATVPLVDQYNSESVITRESKESNEKSFFPFARPLEMIPNPPEGINVNWLGQTGPNSWAELDPAQLAKGEVRPDKGKDKLGPLNVMMSAEGKRPESKATKKTRLVVVGSAHFAGNQFAKFGQNFDLFLNSISWLMEEDNLISIRAKEDTKATVELSQAAGQWIFLVCLILLPLGIGISGIVVWTVRRKL